MARALHVCAWWWGAQCLVSPRAARNGPRPLRGDPPNAPEYLEQLGYEWSQATDSVEVRVVTPDGVDARRLGVDVVGNRLRVTVDDAVLLDGALHGGVVASETLWVLDEGDEDSGERPFVECTLLKKREGLWAVLFDGAPEMADADAFGGERTIDLGTVKHSTTEGQRLSDNTDDVFEFENMKNDVQRTEAYRAAIKNERGVRGKTVLEIGTGALALLALMCADAGATHVYAVEVNAKAAEMARDAVEKRGLSEKITVIQGLSTDIEKLVDKDGAEVHVDVVVSEIVGHVSTGEGAAAVLRDARARFVKPGAVNWSIPAEISTLAVPITLPPGLNKAFDDERAFITDLMGKIDAATLKQLQAVRPDVELGMKKSFFKLSDRLLEDALGLDPAKTKAKPLRGFPMEFCLSDVAKPCEAMLFTEAKAPPDSLSTQVSWKIGAPAMLDGFLLFNTVSCLEPGDCEISAFDGGSSWQPCVVLFDRVAVRAEDVVELQVSGDVATMNPKYTFKAEIRRGGPTAPADQAGEKPWDVQIREARSRARE